MVNISGKFHLIRSGVKQPDAAEAEYNFKAAAK